MSIFNNWTKWILVDKDVPHIKEKYMFFGSYLVSSQRVLMDIYRKENKRAGKVKYKKILK